MRRVCSSLKKRHDDTEQPAYALSIENSPLHSAAMQRRAKFHRHHSLSRGAFALERPYDNDVRQPLLIITYLGRHWL